MLYGSNYQRVLEFNLYEATRAIKELQPLYEIRESQLKAVQEHMRVANENLRDVSLLMATAQQRQTELLEERFASDEDTAEWLKFNQ